MPCVGGLRQMQKVSTVVVSAFVVALGISVFAEQKPASAPTMAVSHANTSVTESQTALVKQYCATCHNDRNKDNAAGLSLQAFDAAKVGHDPQVADTAEKIIRKLRSGMMPPPGSRRPEASVINAFAASMETRLEIGRASCRERV